MICSQCNKEFAPSHHSQIYCSKKCREVRNRKWQRKYTQSEGVHEVIIAKKRIYNKSVQGREVQRIYRNRPERKAAQKIINDERNVINNERLSKDTVSAWLKGDPLPYFKRRISTIKSRCKREGLKFNLTIDHLIKVTLKQNFCCYYTRILLRPYYKGEKKQYTVLGKVINRIEKKPGKSNLIDERLTTISIDRIIPEKGYVIGNIALVSDFINMMKSNFTDSQFKSIISLIAKNHNIKHNYESEDFKKIQNKIKYNMHNDLMPKISELKIDLQKTKDMLDIKKN